MTCLQATNLTPHSSGNVQDPHVSSDQHHHLPPAAEGALTQPYNMQRGYVIAAVLEL